MDLECTPPREQRHIFAARQMDYDSTFSEIGIGESSKIVLMLKLSLLLGI